jgi:hypothetical protein
VEANIFCGIISPIFAEGITKPEDKSKVKKAVLGKAESR